jgi:hypothetical protein
VQYTKVDEDVQVRAANLLCKTLQHRVQCNSSVVNALQDHSICFIVTTSSFQNLTAVNIKQYNIQCGGSKVLSLLLHHHVCCLLPGACYAATPARSICFSASAHTPSAGQTQ